MCQKYTCTCQNRIIEEEKEIPHPPQLCSQTECPTPVLWFCRFTSITHTSSKVANRPFGICGWCHRPCLRSSLTDTERLSPQKGIEAWDGEGRFSIKKVMVRFFSKVSLFLLAFFSFMGLGHSYLIAISGKALPCLRGPCLMCCR